MIDPKQHENHGNERTTFNPKKPGDVERVNPTNGESAGAVGANKTNDG